MAKPHGPASVGPQLPAGLGENVNGGMSINDTRSPDHHANQLKDPNASNSRVVLNEDGTIMTDEPEPQPVPVKRTMRKSARQTQGPVVDAATGTYQPAAYVINRNIDLGNGKSFQHRAVREDR